MESFADFQRTDATYKTVDSHNIELTILTPKNLPAGPHPLIVRFHGGFLFFGGRLGEMFFPKWVLPHVIRHQAIFITADYRMLPEASGTDISSDVASLFTWLETELPFTLSSLSVEADMQNILVMGESAGGYLSMQAALLHGSNGRHRIRACISQFPVLDIETSWYTEAFEKPLMFPEAINPQVIDDHLAAIRDSANSTPKIVSNSFDEDRLKFTIAVVREGRYVEMLGDPEKHPELYPMRNLDRVDPKTLPAVWIFHGRQDSAVPSEGSVMFAEKFKTVAPDAPLRLTLEDGDHDMDSKLNKPEDAAWLRDGLEWLDIHWPNAIPNNL